MSNQFFSCTIATKILDLQSDNDVNIFLSFLFFIDKGNLPIFFFFNVSNGNNSQMIGLILKSKIYFYLLGFIFNYKK